MGADYVMAPQEVPHLRSQFPDKLNLMVNLANDSIGYIIPKSEWDEDAPWIYGENEETYENPYGTEISAGKTFGFGQTVEFSSACASLISKPYSSSDPA